MHLTLPSRALFVALTAACSGGVSTAPVPEARDDHRALASASEPARAGVAPLVNGPLPDPMRCDRGAGEGCFVRLPATQVWVGAQAVDPQAPGHDERARADEAPVHRADVPELWFQADEVSARRYADCLDAGWCDEREVLTEGGLATVRRPGAEHLPAVGVTWSGAVRYCAWLGARLPTEDEWERAARGPQGRRFPWGDAPRCGQLDLETARAASAASGQLVDACGAVMTELQAVLDPEAYQALTQPLQDKYEPGEVVPLCASWGQLRGEALVAAVRDVAQAPRRPLDPGTCSFDGPAIPGDMRDATPEGIRGLGGNVQEWTMDVYAPYGAPAGDASAGADRVQRGGSWMVEDPWELRSAARAHLPPQARLPDVGFRCVRESTP